MLSCSSSSLKLLNNTEHLHTWRKRRGDFKERKRSNAWRELKHKSDRMMIGYGVLLLRRAEIEQNDKNTVVGLEARKDLLRSRDEKECNKAV
jgi:hypothetical protein